MSHVSAYNELGDPCLPNDLAGVPVSFDNPTPEPEKSFVASAGRNNLALRLVGLNVYN